MRVLSNKEFFRVGGDKPIKVDVRILAATHQSLESLVASGTFREDLYYRLNVIRVDVPPLRQRKEDIGDLSSTFLKRHADSLLDEPKALSPEALLALTQYDWPGNVRQFENLLERAILFSGKEVVLTVNHFDFNSEHDIIEDKNYLDLTPMTIAEVEKQLIFSTLKRTSDNRTQAADMLGISVRTLRNKLHQYEKSGDSPFLVGEGN